MADLKFLRGSSESWGTVKSTADTNTFYIVEYPAQPLKDGQAEKYELYLGNKLIGDGTSLEMIDGMLAEYAKKTDLDDYVKTETAELTYAKKTDLDSYVTTETAELTYATKTELEAKADKAAIADMLTKTEASNTYQPKGEYLTEIPQEYITETELIAKNYATKTELSNGLGAKLDTDTYNSDKETFAIKTEVADTYATKAELGATNAGAGLENDGRYIEPVGSNYLSGVTTLKDADIKLDAAIKEVSGKVEEIIADEVNVEAGAGISVESDESGHTATISVKLNENDKVLTADGNGLLANINLTWSSSDGLKLIGKNGDAIATIEATDFIKDGMLQNVELVVLSGGTEANLEGKEDGTYLKFTFNTDGGSKVIYVNVTSLIDVYTGTNGIQVIGKEISIVKASNSEDFLEIGADGIKVSGIQDAIDVVAGVSQAAIDKIEASVGLGEDGRHQTTSGNYTSGATTIAGEIAALDTQVKANADEITKIDAYTVNSKPINSNPTLNGADIKLDRYAQATGTAAELNVAATDTVNVAIGKLEKAIVDKEAVTSEALNKVKTSVGLGDSFDYVAPRGTHVNGATSVKDADEKLDAAIVALEKRTIKAKANSNVEVNSSDGTTTTIGLVWGTF